MPNQHHDDDKEHSEKVDAAASKRKTEGQDFLALLRQWSTPAWVHEKPDDPPAAEEETNDSNLASKKINDNNDGHRSNLSSLSADGFEHEILPAVNTTTTTTTTTKSSPDTSSSRPPLGRKPSQSPLLEPKLSPDKLRHTAGSSPLPPKPPPLTLKHGRKVSWGKEQAERRELQQQQLLAAQQQPQQPPLLEPKKLTLDDVLKHGPFEDETQTGVIHSADERPTTRGRSDTGTSTIFSNVPDIVSHSFEIYPPPNFLGMDIGDDEDARPHHHQESRPLIPIQKKSSRHQRHMSVEQTLMSLTDAMSVMHGQHHATSSSSSPLSSHRQHSHRRLHTGISIASNNKNNDFAHDALAVMADPKNGERDGIGKEGVVSSSKQDAESIKSSGTTTKKEEGMPRIDSSDTLLGDDIETGNSDSEESLAYSVGNNNQNNHADSEGSSPHQNKTNSNSNKSSNQGKNARKKPKKKRGKRASTIDTFKEDWDVWSEFFRPRRKRILLYIKCILFYFLLPALGSAAILFYLRGNPTKNNESPSSSYILLFCCRQIITFSMALAMQAFMIDFICLGTKLMLRLVGPVVTLLIVQSKGWPHIFFWWALFDFSMVSGAGPFAQHWAYYQKLIPLLNEENTSGNLVSSELYFRILTIVLSVSLVVAVKRFAIGLYLGRQTFTHYGLSLAEVMNKMLLVSKVASLAKEIEDEPSV
jgi:hypothetical protein